MFPDWSGVRARSNRSHTGASNGVGHSDGPRVGPASSSAGRLVASIISSIRASLCPVAGQVGYWPLSEATDGGGRGGGGAGGSPPDLQQRRGRRRRPKHARNAVALRGRLGWLSQARDIFPTPGAVASPGLGTPRGDVFYLVRLAARSEACAAPVSAPVTVFFSLASLLLSFSPRCSLYERLRFVVVAFRKERVNGLLGVLAKP